VPDGGINSSRRSASVPTRTPGFPRRRPRTSARGRCQVSPYHFLPCTGAVRL
jgi:hypothetical protein